MSTLDEGPYCHRLDKVSLRQGSDTCGAQRAVKLKACGRNENLWASHDWILIPILEVTIRLKIQSIQMDLKSNDSRFKNI